MTRALDAIIFDFDGVIADSERLHLRAFQEVLRPLGLDLSNEAYYADYLGYDDVGVFRKYAADRSLSWDDAMRDRLLAAKAERFDTLVADGEMLFPGAATFIRITSDAVPIAIASGALTHEIEDVLTRAGLRHCFTAIVGADQTLRSKPSPDPYLEAFHRVTARGHAISPSRTVAIEDSHWGLVSAATAKLRVVAVATTYPAAELAPHAELVVSGLEALTLEALDALCASDPVATHRRLADEAAPP
jgi:beta-phosphoglucomutase